MLTWDEISRLKRGTLLDCERADGDTVYRPIEATHVVLQDSVYVGHDPSNTSKSTWMVHLLRLDNGKVEHWRDTRLRLFGARIVP